MKLILFFIISVSFLANHNLESKIYLGIDVLASKNFSILDNKNVGLLTHAAGLNRNGVPTLEILFKAKNFKLVSLFSPEHGLYGDKDANIHIENNIHKSTKLPIYSLYGQHRKPTKEMLAGIDVMVIDLQDIGVRSYTYVSCMLYTLEACFENNIEVVVLDRPNPLGGIKIDGPIIDKDYLSYVGPLQIPYIHGLTIGELSLLAKNRMGWLNIELKSQKCGKLTVVPMKGWRREMTWPQTKLEWISTSPNIPSFASVIGYAMTGLGAEEGEFSHGIGTPYPFRLLTHKSLKNTELKKILDGYKIPGLKFKIIETKNKKGRPIRGIYVGVSNWEKLSPTMLSFYMMDITKRASTNNPFVNSSKKLLFNKHVGSSSLWENLISNNDINLNYFFKYWSLENRKFKKMINSVLIYR